MKILVPIKRVPDPQTNIAVRPDGTGIVTDNVKFVINPFCEIALEESLRIKEAQGEGEVVLVSIGGKECQEQLRTGLAMGADRAILVVTDGPLDPARAAEVLAKLVAQESPNLVFLGKQAIDDDANQTGQLLAAMLDWPQATFASKVVIGDDKKSVTVTREVDGGLETVAFDLPGIITSDLRLNEPRYASLPGIMKARKKELKEVPLAETGVSAEPKVKQVKIEPPPKRQGGRKVETVQELVNLLHTEAKLI
ncbi:MAG: electron transfer flavoprotein subunit beta/FixA family protein [Deltaproteobacteria bacterium]|nr:electron transfer flavoprotein subunit beta/FixA family protein [Deltaproteobacteria bacterium]